MLYHFVRLVEEEEETVVVTEEGEARQDILAVNWFVPFVIR
jgi:hypothetical protein